MIIYDACERDKGKDKGCPVRLTEHTITNRDVSGDRDAVAEAFKAAKKSGRPKNVVFNYLGDDVSTMYTVFFGSKRVRIGCYSFSGENRLALLKWLGVSPTPRRPRAKVKK